MCLCAIKYFFFSLTLSHLYIWKEKENPVRLVAFRLLQCCYYRSRFSLASPQAHRDISDLSELSVVQSCCYCKGSGRERPAVGWIHKLFTGRTYYTMQLPWPWAWEMQHDCEKIFIITHTHTINVNPVFNRFLCELRCNNLVNIR